MRAGATRPSSPRTWTRTKEENGDEVFCSVDDEQELAAVYEAFMAQLFDDEDSDEPDEE